ncbi:MAG TPA: penicillin-binding protein activator LpoB [Planctomycetaceae bacterium]|nr:penicillin-binding protein activator LpoB [Planctomycetaceae bacterium]
MARYRIIVGLLCGIAAISSSVGCRNHQHAQVLKQDDKDMVGSHTAGAETWKPLIDESVCRLLAKSASTVHQASHTKIDGEGGVSRTVCFVGVENRSGEEIGDFKEQMYEHIDSLVSQDPQFHMISRRAVEAAMLECRCRPDTLLLPAKQRELQLMLEKDGMPFDYLLFASITSGTTNSNGDYQRDYLLTLELIDIHTGESQKDSAMLRKGYHKGLFGKLKH